MSLNQTSRDSARNDSMPFWDDDDDEIIYEVPEEKEPQLSFVELAELSAQLSVFERKEKRRLRLEEKLNWKQRRRGLKVLWRLRVRNDEPRRPLKTQ